MGKYLRNFESFSDFEQEYYGENYIEPWVSYTHDGTDEDVRYNKNTHEFVDLGLPSGNLWATMNIGANSPMEPGDYFAWGETRPKANYSKSTYKYWDSTNQEYTKYNDEDGIVALSFEDDAAYVNWPDDMCQMPSVSDFEELIQYTTHDSYYDEETDTYAWKFTAKDGSGNYILFPFTQFIDDDWGTRGIPNETGTCHPFPHESYDVMRLLTRERCSNPQTYTEYVTTEDAAYAMAGCFHISYICTVNYQFSDSNAIIWRTDGHSVRAVKHPPVPPVDPNDYD